MSFYLKMSDYSDIHKRARILEGELDAKLISFNKMCSNQNFKAKFPAAIHGVTLPSEHAVEAAGAEIQDLLGKLNHLNGEMSILTEEKGPAPVSVRHTLQRHGEILQEYGKEFQKIFENYKSVKERATILETKRTGESDIFSDALAEEEFLLIKNSEIPIETSLSVADTKMQLLSQRKSIKKMQTHLRNLYHRFPVFNDLIRRSWIAKHQHYVVLAVMVLLIVGVLALLPWPFREK